MSVVTVSRALVSGMSFVTHTRTHRETERQTDRQTDRQTEATQKKQDGHSCLMLVCNTDVEQSFEVLRVKF